VAALYAFCRSVDDLADAEQVTAEARSELDALQAALGAEPDGEPLWPEGHLWFRRLCLECGIDFRVVRDLLAGMASDLGTVRLQSDRELLRYCYRAAGTVGLMMCSVLGVRDPRAWRHAIDLGIAMQLTNVCRDVLEDAQASRVYLPADRLRAYGVGPEDLVEGRADAQAVSLVVTDLLALAEGYYRSGDEGMRFLPPRARWAILIASRLYRGIGRRLRNRLGSNALLGRVAVPWLAKLGLVLSATGSWLRLSLWPPKAFAAGNQPGCLAGLPYVGAGVDAGVRVDVQGAGRLGDGRHTEPAEPSPVGTDAGAGADAGAVPVRVVSRKSHALGHTH
jgi:phytoene synthase